MCDDSLRSDDSVGIGKTTTNVLSSFQAATTEILEDKSLETMKTYYEFPKGITCNNECFNVDAKGNNPSTLFRLKTSFKMEKEFLFKDKQDNDVFTYMPFLVWRVAVDSTNEKERRTDYKKESKGDDLLLGAMSHLNFGTKGIKEEW